jgi:gliding motility-associated-like protein/uncharacterized repeat protein (TIGR01451 family)
VKATDQLQSGYTFVSDNGAGAFEKATGIWTIGNLANGATAVLKITTTVNASGSYANTATATADQPDPIPGGNASTVTPVPIPVSNIVVTKTVDELKPFVGNDVVFTITVTNNGPSDATGVFATDKLANGYTYVSDNGLGAFNSNTGVWTIGNLANGDTVKLEITANVNVTGEYANTATAQSDQLDLISASNESTVTPTPVLPTVLVPQGFSPNGDGLNDKLQIGGIDVYDNEIFIYNRWGNQVYHKTNYRNEVDAWEGYSEGKMTVGGEKLPVGTYFYILYLEGFKKPLKGYIYLQY